MSLRLVRPDWIPRRPQAFACSLDGRGGDVAAIQLAGEVRVATAPELARSLRRAQRQARLVVLDLRRLTVIDPCGVHVIVAAGIRARRAGRRVVVVRGPAPDAGLVLSVASKAFDVVELEPWQAVVQALLELAREERAA